MMPFIEIEHLQAAAFAGGHPLEGVILRGRCAGRICMSAADGSIFSFGKDHRRTLRPKHGRRAEAALRRLRESLYYRWWIGPEPAPEITIEDAARMLPKWEAA